MAAPDREVESLRIGVVHVGDRLRPVTDAAVETLAASMAAIGQINPIEYRMVDMVVIDGREVCGVPVIVAGATRLAAAKRLGWDHIEALVVDIDADEARKYEIAENLHRNDLTVLERKQHQAEWLRLTEKQSAAISAQGCAKNDRGRPEGGIRAAARELQIDRDEARRSVAIASISERAKQAAIENRLDNNQSALLKVAASQPAEQVEKVRQLAAERDARKAARGVTTVPLAADPISDEDAVEKQFARLMSAWNAACPEARQRFDDARDRPVMDRARA